MARQLVRRCVFWDVGPRRNHRSLFWQEEVLAFVNKLRAYAPKNPPSVSRQSADDFPQIRFSREVSAFALHETVTVPLSRQAGQNCAPSCLAPRSMQDRRSLSGASWGFGIDSPVRHWKICHSPFPARLPSTVSSSTKSLLLSHPAHVPLFQTRSPPRRRHRP